MNKIKKAFPAIGNNNVLRGKFYCNRRSIFEKKALKFYLNKLELKNKLDVTLEEIIDIICPPFSFDCLR